MCALSQIVNYELIGEGDLDDINDRNKSPILCATSEILLSHRPKEDSVSEMGDKVFLA
jgi:hypothetical protein